MPKFFLNNRWEYMYIQQGGHIGWIGWICWKIYSFFTLLAGMAGKPLRISSFLVGKWLEFHVKITIFGWILAVGMCGHHVSTFEVRYV